MDNTPFHPDELAAQALAGQTSRGTGIRPFMPDQHRSFFALLPYLFVASADTSGWPLASVLHGKPGFVQAPDATTLRIEALPSPGDPVTAGLRAGRNVGLLGIDLSNRRRNRANGTVLARDQSGITVVVAQSFGNCAQYVQTRRPSTHRRLPAPIEPLDGLDPAAHRLIANCDTFFVASRSRHGLERAGGLDISHRGGRPGFVDVRCDTLTIPEFRGNRYFNTLGNLLGDPRASLLFVDFASGALLQLQGLVAIDWSGQAAAKIAGAERSWRMKITRAWWQPHAFPFEWTFDEYAPTTLATGIWASGPDGPEGVGFGGDGKGALTSAIPPDCELSRARYR